MLEIEKLEKEWRKYKIKQLKPYVFISILLALSAIFLTLYSKDTTKLVQQIAFNDEGAKREVVVIEKKLSDDSAQVAATKREQNSPQTLPSDGSKISFTKTDEYETEKELDSKDSKRAKREVESLELRPNTDFLKTFALQSIHLKSKDSESSKKTTTPIQRQATERLNSISQDMKQETKTEKTSYSPSNVKESSSLVLTTTKTNNTLEYLVKRFSEKRDPKLASYISRSYYKKGKYKEALKWSIEANSLDPSNEESWILFAKANEKLGNKEEAIQALKVYLNQYSSKSVKSLLNSLESDR